MHEERRGNLYCSERRKVGQWPDSWCHGCSCMCTDQSGTAIDTPNVQPVLHCSSLSWIFAKSSRACSVSLLFVGCVKGAVGKKRKKEKREKERNVETRRINMRALCERTVDSSGSSAFLALIRSTFFGSFGSNELTKLRSFRPKFCFLMDINTVNTYFFISSNTCTHSCLLG